MPLVQIKGISGILTHEQKQEMIKKVTDAIVSVEGEGLRPVTWVLIEDVPSGAWVSEETRSQPNRCGIWLQRNNNP